MEAARLVPMLTLNMSPSVPCRIESLTAELDGRASRENCLNMLGFYTSKL